VQRYQGRISGPLLDRIDMLIEVGALTHEELLDAPAGESSALIVTRVEQAAALQQARQGKLNHALAGADIDRFCRPDGGGEKLLRLSMQRFDWSARAYHRVLKVARTIADLAGTGEVGESHVAEAIQYRRGLHGL
jgi:magnesium chelatase family protein